MARGGHEAWLLRGLELPFRLMKCSRIQQVMVAQFCEHAKKHYSVHFKRVNSMAWEFHLNEAIKATKKTTQEAVDSPPSRTHAQSVTVTRRNGCEEEGVSVGPRPIHGSHSEAPGLPLSRAAEDESTRSSPWGAGRAQQGHGRHLRGPRSTVSRSSAECPAGVRGEAPAHHAQHLQAVGADPRHPAFHGGSSDPAQTPKGQGPGVEGVGSLSEDSEEARGKNGSEDAVWGGQAARGPGAPRQPGLRPQVRLSREANSSSDPLPGHLAIVPT